MRSNRYVSDLQLLCRSCVNGRFCDPITIRVINSPENRRKENGMLRLVHQECNRALYNIGIAESKPIHLEKIILMYLSIYLGFFSSKYSKILLSPKNFSNNLGFGTVAVVVPNNGKL